MVGRVDGGQLLREERAFPDFAAAAIYLLGHQWTFTVESRVDDEEILSGFVRDGARRRAEWVWSREETAEVGVLRICWGHEVHGASGGLRRRGSRAGVHRGGGQSGKITLVTFALGAFMRFRVVRIEVFPRRNPGGHLAVLHCRAAIALLVNVESALAFRHAGHRDLERHPALLGFGHRSGANLFPNILIRDAVDIKTHLLS